MAKWITYGLIGMFLVLSGFWIAGLMGEDIEVKNACSSGQIDRCDRPRGCIAHRMSDTMTDYDHDRAEWSFVWAGQR